MTRPGLPGLAAAAWLAALLLLGAACGDDGDSPTDTTTPNAGAEERRGFIDEARDRLARLEEEIDELEAGAREKTGDERAELEEQVEGLQGRVDDIGQKLRDIELGDERSFEDLKTDVDAALDDARSELNRLMDSLGI
jgi:chromosome segregation ATPase